MSLHFYCQCGRKLTAADDPQGSATCPSCGMVVTAPSPGEHGASGDSTATREFFAQSGKRPLGLKTVSLRSFARQRKWRPRWGHSTPFDVPRTDSLWLPFTEMWAIGRISLFMAIGLQIVRSMMVSEWRQREPLFAVITLGYAIVFGAISLGLLGQFLSHVVTEGAASAGQMRLWTGFSLKGTVAAAVRWLTVMLAGPGYVLALGIWYWIHSGVLGVVDRFVLFEAAVVGCGWMVFGLLSTRGDKPLRAAAPDSVARTVAQFGWESLGFAIWAGTIFWTTAGFFLTAIELMQRDESLAVFFVCWFGFAFAIGASATLLLRLGVRYAQRTFVPPAERTADGAKPSEHAAV